MKAKTWREAEQQKLKVNLLSSSNLIGLSDKNACWEEKDFWNRF
jgi:hypothetical protein